MSDETLITQEAAENMLRAYGAAPKQWPEELRLTLQQAIDRYPDLKAVVEEEAILDGRLDEFRPAVAMTVEGVIAKVGATESGSRATSGRWLENFIDWLVPSEDVVWWRGAITAVVPLVVGVWLGSAVPADQEQWEGTEQAFFSGYYALDFGGIDND
jgi:hypothetical protein